MQRWSRSQFGFFGMLLFVGLLAMTARNAVDPDLWWHLRTGEWILGTGEIPKVDSFSFTRAGSPWVSHEWLSDVAFFEIWRHGGAGALIVFSAVVTAAGFMLLFLRCPGKPAAAAAAVTLGALAAAPAWGARPQMFTFTLASLMLWLLERGEQRPLSLLWIPPIFLLWLNLHAGFALGPALLLAFALGLVWEAAAGKSPWEQVRGYLTRVVLVLLVCMALVPLNPSGTQLYRYPLDVLRSAGMRSFIAEWFPPDFHQLRYLPLILMWLGLLIGFVRSQSRPRARTLFPLLLTLVAAIDAVRHIPIFVLLATPILAAAFSVGPESRKRTVSSARQYPIAFRGAVLVLMAVFAAVRWGGLTGQQSKAEREQYPAGAVEYLLSHQPTGDAGRVALPSRLFIYYDWGGYAIWSLYPEYRVFVDGRADLYGDDLLHQFQDVLQLRPKWKEVLDSWRVETVLVPGSSALAEALALDAGWREEHRDSLAVVFVRDTARDLR